jgi:hypothetical protein
MAELFPRFVDLRLQLSTSSAGTRVSVGEARILWKSRCAWALLVSG